MRKHLKHTIFTITETVFLEAAIFGFLLYRESISSVTKNRLIGVFFLLLALLLFLKRQLRRLKRYRIRHFSIRRIDRMSGEEFEIYMKVRFEALGFRVSSTKTSNDYGADLILKKKKQIIAVQCKRYQSNIGVRAIQEVIGSMAYYGASRGLVVTNSYYTSNAKQLAYANDVILWDRDVLFQVMGDENVSGYLSELLENR